MIVSSSRDKNVLTWDIRHSQSDFGSSKKSLHGHSHHVEDVVISSDGLYALSSSWDGTLRLWDIIAGTTTRRFVGHTKDVLSVAFSSDNRHIVSGSRDRSIKLWNTLGECKYTIEDAHDDWVSCVKFSPNMLQPMIVSAGWDGVIKVWSLSNCKLLTSLVGHTGPVYTVAVSPDASLVASGGKDQTAKLWDLNEGKLLYSLDAGDVINTLCFSPTRFWLCAGTNTGIKIWDLETKELIVDVDHSHPDFQQPHSKKVGCTSLAWSADGSILYAGYTDSNIRVWSPSI